MAEDKMITLRQQLSENQQDLQDYLADIDSWTDDIKKKETALSKERTIEEPKLPPVRNSLTKRKKKLRKKVKIENGVSHTESEKQPKPTERIGGYEYRKWDKFDVNKACEEVDGEKSSSSSLSEYETDEEWENERKKHLAEQEKESGNEHFKKGEYDLAVECYTRGIDFDPTNPLLPGNRAMAYLKQDKFVPAINDCTMALSLDPFYIKAYLRRASAQVGLNKLADAKSDYEKILTLEPQNKSAKLEKEKIESELNKINNRGHVDSLLETEESQIIKPIYKAPEQRSKKPLVRIAIEEIGIEEDIVKQNEISRVKDSQSETKKSITAHDDKTFEKYTQKENLEADTRIVEAGDREIKCINTKLAAEKCDIAKSPESSLKDLPNEEFRIQYRDTNTPLTSFQFQADYKVLKNNSKLFYPYLKRIEAGNLVQLFGQALDADILVKMFTVFKDFFIPDGIDVVPFVQNLVNVQRFEMTILFLSAKEKRIVGEVFDHLRDTNTLQEDDLQILRKKYSL